MISAKNRSLDKRSLELDNWNNQSEIAQSVLEQLLDTSAEKTKADPDQVFVSDARHASKVLYYDSARTQSRVVFVTSDTSVLEQKSAAILSYASLAVWFDEVHIMVLQPSAKSCVPKRVTKSLFVYAIGGTDPDSVTKNATACAADHLQFNGSVRPDIVVGTDPLLAGEVAEAVAADLGREWQIQVTKDYFSKYSSDRLSYWQKKQCLRLLKSAPSVRAQNIKILNSIKDQVRNLTKNTNVLPAYYDFLAFEQTEPAWQLKEKYPDFKFVIVAFAPLTADGHLHEVFTALRNILFQNRIGLVVVGTGPAKNLFQEKVQVLQLEKNVVFVEPTTDILPYIKTADVIIELGVMTTDDITVLKTIAAGTPLLAYETKARLDLLEDGVSAFLCPPGDTFCIKQKMNKLINNQSVRVQFARQSKQIRSERLHEDPDSFFQAMRDSIETALIEVPTAAEVKTT